MVAALISHINGCRDFFLLVFLSLSLALNTRQFEISQSVVFSNSIFTFCLRCAAGTATAAAIIKIDYWQFSCTCSRIHGNCSRSQAKSVYNLHTNQPAKLRITVFITSEINYIHKYEDHSHLFTIVYARMIWMSTSRIFRFNGDTTSDPVVYSQSLALTRRSSRSKWDCNAFNSVSLLIEWYSSDGAVDVFIGFEIRAIRHTLNFSKFFFSDDRPVNFDFRDWAS